MSWDFWEDMTVPLARLSGAFNRVHGKCGLNMPTLEEYEDSLNPLVEWFRKDTRQYKKMLTRAYQDNKCSDRNANLALAKLREEQRKYRLRRYL